jgi:hypothetical protein
MMQKRNLKPKKGKQVGGGPGLDFSLLTDMEIIAAIQQSVGKVMEASAVLQNTVVSDYATVAQLTAVIGFEYRFSSECYAELARRQQGRRVNSSA